MVLPTPDWDGVEVRWRGVLLDGSPASGQLIITADAPRFLDEEVAQSISVFSVPINVPITDGYASVVLPATDDPDLTPQAFTYTVTEKLNRGKGETYTISVPLLYKDTGMDLNKAVRVGPAPGTPQAPITRNEFNALSYSFVRHDQIAVSLDEDGVPYFTDSVEYADAYAVTPDDDGVPCIVID